AFFGLPGAGSGSQPVTNPNPPGSSAPPPQVTVIAGPTPPTGTIYGSSATPVAGQAVGPPQTPTINAAHPANPSFRSVTVTYNQVSGATGYQLYRSTNPTSGFTQVGQSLNNQTQIQDGNLPGPGTYYYQVVATGVNGARSQPSQAYPVTVR